MTVVTFHQPNFAPGASVITKILASDAVVWMDTVQYTKGGWTNRQKLPDGTWLTIPVAHTASFAPINRVQIGQPGRDWRPGCCERIRQAWPGPTTDAVCGELLRCYPLLVGLNAAVLRHILAAFGYRGEQHWQSHLDDAHAVPAASDSAAELAPISQRIAEMVDAIGGTTYLSGPSGRRYLDETPFAERGIDVAYWRHDGPNPCALELVADAKAVAA